MDLKQFILDYSQAISAVSTSIYTILTLLLIFLTFRYTQITNRLLLNQRRPIIIPTLTFGTDGSLYVTIENLSAFISNYITLYAFFSPPFYKKIKISSLTPNTKDRLFIANKNTYINYKYITLKIKYKNEDGQRFKSYYKLDIPMTERRN